MFSYSLCMIVKDEENKLERSLGAIGNAVDEIIIVDTGSTDKTKEIAKKFTSNIYDYEWKNDYAAARNFAISKAQGDYILMLDADEVVTTEHFNKFKEYMEETEKHTAAYEFLVNNLVEGGGLTKHYRICVIRNDPKIQYEGVVHETPGDSIRALGETVTKINLPVMHYGYVESGSVLKKVRERNLPLLLNAFNDDPNNGGYAFYLGKTYLVMLQDLNQAKRYFEIAREKTSKENKPLQYESLFFLGVIDEKQGRIGDALEKWEEVYNVDPDFPDVYFAYAVIMMRYKRYRMARLFLEKCFELKDGTSKVLNIMRFLFDDRKLAEMLEYCYEQNEDYKGSIAMLKNIVGQKEVKQNG